MKGFGTKLTSYSPIILSF